jgi:threonyl-tRNA synthetase
MLIVGEKEASSGTVSLRKRAGGDQGAIAIDDLISQARELIHSRART